MLRKFKLTVGTKFYTAVGILAFVYVLTSVLYSLACNDMSYYDKTNNNLTNALSCKSNIVENVCVIESTALESYLLNESTISNLGNTLTEIDSNAEELVLLSTELNNSALLDATKSLQNSIQVFNETAKDLESKLNNGLSNETVVLLNDLSSTVESIKETSNNITQIITTDLDYYTERSSNKISGTNLFALLLAFVYTVLSVIIAVIANRTIVKPAKLAGNDLQVIVDGIKNASGDLTLRVPVYSEDEIGNFSKAVNLLMEQLQSTILIAKDASTKLYTSASSISDKLQESTDDAGNISATMEELSASVEEISATLSQVKTNVALVLKSIKDMSDITYAGVDFVVDIKRRADVAKTSAEDGKDKTIEELDTIKTAVENAVHESKDVDKILDLVTEILAITSKTNLLALNASIEAARAGEAGRGFTVVAEEIRVLADSSKETANKIQVVSDDVMDSVKKLTSSSEEMCQFMDSIVLSDYSNFVKTAAQYADDADKMNSLLENFKCSFASVADAMELTASEINDITSNVVESANDITCVAVSTSNLVDTLSSLQGESDNAKFVAGLLDLEVNRFSNL